jgi:tetratricopeptide (TPR) repeat protein
MKQRIMSRRIQKAISEYQRMTTEDPKNVRIRTKLADLYLKNDDMDRAIEEYLKVGKQYAEDDFKSKAVSIYKKVLKLEPKMVGVYHSLAGLYRAQVFLADARALYEVVMRLDPADEFAKTAVSEIEKCIFHPQSLRCNGATVQIRNNLHSKCARGPVAG